HIDNVARASDFEEINKEVDILWPLILDESPNSIYLEPNTPASTFLSKIGEIGYRFEENVRGAETKTFFSMFDLPMRNPQHVLHKFSLIDRRIELREQKFRKPLPEEGQKPLLYRNVVLEFDAPSPTQITKGYKDRETEQDSVYYLFSNPDHKLMNANGKMKRNLNVEMRKD